MIVPLISHSLYHYTNSILHIQSPGSKYHAHEVVKLILATGVSINTCDYEKRTALHIACLSHYLFQGHHRYLHVAEILLWNGIDFTLTDNLNRRAFECIDDETCRNVFLNSCAYQKAQRARRRRAFLIVMHQKDFSLGLKRNARASHSYSHDQVVLSTAAISTSNISTGISAFPGRSGGGWDSITSYSDVPPPPPSNPNAHSNTHTHTTHTSTNSHPYSNRYPYPNTNPVSPSTITRPITPILPGDDNITTPTPSPILAPRPRLALGFHAPDSGTFPCPNPPPPPPINVPRSNSTTEINVPVFGRVRSMSITKLFKKITEKNNNKNYDKSSPNASPSPSPSPSPSSSPTSRSSPNLTDNPSPNPAITITGSRQYPATYQVFAIPEICAHICRYL